MSGQHARLSASAAHRWLNCPASVKASEGMPDSTSVHAAAGTFAHHIAAECLTKGADPKEWLGNTTIVDGHKVTCDEEMVDAINVYLQAVGDRTGQAEMPLLEALQRFDPDLGGTADYVCLDGKTLHVFDFKYGSGSYVDADANEQMMLYALGAMLAIGKPVTEVTVTIVQPRYEAAEPVRSYSFKAVDILDFAADISAAAEKTRLPEPPYKAGDHCQWCKAARTCPELERRQHALVAAEFTAATVYDPQKLADALASIPVVKERIKALEEFAYAEACRGKDIPGFKLVDKRAMRKWKSDGDVIEWAEKQAVDPYAPRELLSPAQLEKKVKKLPPELIVQQSSGTTLVPVSDKRPPVKPISIEDFSVVEG